MAVTVTVIISTYNHEKYIAQAIESVLSQKTDFEFDVVVIEDCSTDKTAQIVARYEEENSGMLRAHLSDVNRCSNRKFIEVFESSAAEFIAILDGDDYWTTNLKLQRQFDFMTNHPECSLCFHDAFVLENDLPRARTYVPGEVSTRIFSSFEDLLKGPNGSPNFIPGCSAFVRKRAIRTLPPGFEDYELADWGLYLLVAEHGIIGFIDEPLGAYRIHATGYWQGRSTRDKYRSLKQLLVAVDEDLAFRHHRTIRQALRVLRIQWTIRIAREHLVRRYVSLLSLVRRGQPSTPS